MSNDLDLVALTLLTGVAPRCASEGKSKCAYKSAYEKYKKQRASGRSSQSESSKGAYWPAGTGYGHGSTSAAAAKLQKAHEEKEKKANEDVSSIITSVLSKLKAGTKDKKFVEALGSSSLVPWIMSLLKNTSTLEMSKRVALYNTVFKILEEIASKPELVHILLPTPVEKKTNDHNLKELLFEQKKIADMLLKFTKNDSGLKVTKNDSGSKFKELVTNISKTYKIVASSVKAHLEKLESKKPAEKKVVQKKEEKVKKKAKFSKVYGWVDEKEYVKVLKPQLFAEMADFKTHYFWSKKAKGRMQVGSKWMNRMGAEIVGLSKSLPLNPNSSVFFRWNSKNMACAKVMIAAPPGTPYGYGLFLFDVYFPSEYPDSPPKVNLMTTGRQSVNFNPNLYDDGYVCLSLLGTWEGAPEEAWQPQQSTFLQVCVSIQSLIFVEHPYFNEPGAETEIGTEHGDEASLEYNANIETSTVQWAMLDMLQNPPPGFEDIVKAHFFLQQKNICEQIDKWLESPHHKNGKALRQFYDQLKEEFLKLKPVEVPKKDEEEDEDDDEF